MARLECPNCNSIQSHTVTSGGYAMCQNCNRSRKLNRRDLGKKSAYEKKLGLEAGSTSKYGGG